jgi:hypothetical protein
MLIIITLWLEQGRDAREEEKKTKERIKKYRDNERKV